ncbi:hypothetical protein [Nocardia sp. NPDC051463]|uniref:hypothetical protein n=1 Tax=Nocardia sp. NPDC051463 TaxID=3154845 RepID=UPI003450E534
MRCSADADAPRYVTERLPGAATVNMLIVGAVVVVLGLLIMLTTVLLGTRSPRKRLTVADLQARLAEEGGTDADEPIGQPAGHTATRE